MAFEWHNTLEGKIEAQDIIEIKNNTDYLASQLGLTLTWNNTIATGESIKKSTLQEFQNNIDYIDNNKQCLNDYAAYNATENADKDEVVDTSKNTSIDTNYHQSIYTSRLYGVRDGANTGIKYTDYQSYDNSDHSTVKSENYSGLYGGYNLSVT